MTGTRASALHPRNQALAAARHDHVDAVRHVGEHVAHRRPIRGRHPLDAGRRQTGALQPLLQAGMDGGARAHALRAAAQNHRVARLQAQRAGVRGDVRTALVDDADHARAARAPAECAGRSAAAIRRAPCRWDRRAARSPRGRAPWPRCAAHRASAGRAAPATSRRAAASRRSASLAASIVPAMRAQRRRRGRSARFFWAVRASASVARPRRAARAHCPHELAAPSPAAGRPRGASSR